MAARTLGATFNGYESVQDSETVVFDSDIYADSDIPNGTVTGGTITFTNIRTYYSDFYFIISVDGEPACETERITDQNDSPHNLTVSIDTEWNLYSNVLLSGSGAISVQLVDNKDRGTNICRFEYGATVTISASHNVAVSPKKPKISQNNNGTQSISWDPASTSGGSGSVTYVLVYTADGLTKDVGTSRSTTLSISSSWYGSSVRFYVVAYYSGVSGSSEYEYFTPVKPTVSAPTLLKINDGDAYTGSSAPLSWTGSTLSYTTGTITYSIRFNGTQVASTTSTEYTVPSSVTKDYKNKTVNVTVVGKCGSYSSTESNSVTYVYDPGYSFVSYFVNGEFIPCVPYYYTNGKFVECVPYYYTTGKFVECSI